LQSNISFLRQTNTRWVSLDQDISNKAFLQAAIEVIEEIDSHLVEVNEKN
jgi:hypothetical protein